MLPQRVLHLSRLLAIAAAASACFAAGAVGQTEALLAERGALRDAKLEEPWLQVAPWTTDFDAARRRAAADGKLIFAYFTRSFAP